MTKHTAMAFPIAALLVACGDASRTVAPEGPSFASTQVTADASTASQIAQLRRLVAPFHQFETAVNAGWSVQFTPCLEAPGVGGMGFHYGNPAYVEDGGAVNLLQPELLLYAPQKNGQMRFIGVEYIVLFSDHPATEPPPTLLGQAFEPVPDAGLWGMHIYVGQHNPSGIFATWNPRVNCDNAGTPTSAAGHRHGR
jgi:hypothetical protein